MNLMKDIAEDTKVIDGKGTVPFDAARANTAARAIAEHSADVMASFASQADDPKSEALPEIWKAFGDLTRMSRETEETAGAARMETRADAVRVPKALGQARTA